MSACIATKVFTKNGNYFVKSYVMCDRLFENEIRQIVFNWDHKITADENHEKAAMALAKKLKWSGDWIAGDAGDQYIWVRQHHLTFQLMFQLDEFSIDEKKTENVK